jgi:hypothetical protein
LVGGVGLGGVCFVGVLLFVCWGVLWGGFVLLCWLWVVWCFLGVFGVGVVVGWCLGWGLFFCVWGCCLLLCWLVGGGGFCWLVGFVVGVGVVGVVVVVFGVVVVVVFLVFVVVLVFVFVFVFGGFVLCFVVGVLLVCCLVVWVVGVVGEL